MLVATRGDEFSFNSQKYKQLDGVAMGSPLGPALANGRVYWPTFEAQLRHSRGTTEAQLPN